MAASLGSELSKVRLRTVSLKSPFPSLSISERIEILIHLHGSLGNTYIQSHHTQSEKGWETWLRHRCRASGERPHLTLSTEYCRRSKPNSPASSQLHLLQRLVSSKHLPSPISTRDGILRVPAPSRGSSRISFSLLVWLVSRSRRPRLRVTSSCLSRKRAGGSN